MISNIGHTYKNFEFEPNITNQIFECFVHEKERQLFSSNTSSLVLDTSPLEHQHPSENTPVNKGAF